MWKLIMVMCLPTWNAQTHQQTICPPPQIDPAVYASKQDCVAAAKRSGAYGWICHDDASGAQVSNSPSGN